MGLSLRVQNSGVVRGCRPRWAFAHPAVNEAERRAMKADRARLVAFAVVDPNRAACAVDVACREREDFANPQAVAVEHDD